MRASQRIDTVEHKIGQTKASAEVQPQTFDSFLFIEAMLGAIEFQLLPGLVSV
jgi:uncharacterized transporter YbjL